VAKKRTERQRMRKILRTQLPFPFDVDKFLDRAIRDFPQDPGAYAYALIINSKAFAKRFPGIKRKDGTLRVSPAEYVSRQEQFRSTAAQFGFGLSRAQMGALVSKGVDPQEFTVRARGVQLVNSNPGTIDFLNKQIKRINDLRRKNEVPGRIPRIKTRKDAIDFFTGRGDRQLYAVYEGALFQQTAKDAGIRIDPKRAAKLAKTTAGVLDLEAIEEGFGSISAQLRLAGVELRQAGISQREQEILEFGGPGREAIRQKVERELRNRQASLEQEAPSQRIGLDEQGRPITGGGTAAGF